MMMLMEMQMTQMNTLMQARSSHATLTAATVNATLATAPVAPAPVILPVEAAVAAANVGLLAAEAKLATAKKLPEELLKHFKDTARDFERRTTKYLNVNKTKQALKEKCEVFAGNNPANGFKYPNGVRAWHAPVEVDSIDEGWSSAKDEDHCCTITIPKGTSRRDAMQRIHYVCQGWLTDLHYETVAAHAEVLRRTVAKDEFVKACGAWQPAQPTAEDGLDAPLRRVADSEEARAQVELLYGKIVDDARVERDKKDKELLARAEAEKKKLEEAAKLPPQKTLVSLIDERIAAKVKDADDEGDEDMEADETALKTAEEFVKGVTSGNGGAPKVGKGSATKAQPPKKQQQAQQARKQKEPAKGGAGKGSKKQKKKQPRWWKPHDGGKGTGKGKSPAKGKGKGDGKGKGKGQQQSSPARQQANSYKKGKGKGQV